MKGHADIHARRWIVATLPRLVIVAVLWLAIGSAPVLKEAGVDAGSLDPRVLSLQPIAENPSWQNDIINSSAGNGGYVYPISVTVLRNAAQVDNPTGLTAAGGGVTTIHATGVGQPALVLDLGVNTGGYIQVGLTAGDGTPVLLAYAEAQRFLTPLGDGGISAQGLDDDPNGRTDLITSTVGPLQFQSPGIRGAERWVLLQLQGAGTVSIDYVRVHVTHYQPSATDYAGHFLSNDDQINRMWYASVYTDNLATTRDGKRGGNLVVMDAGKRDRMVFPGDLGMEGLTDYYSVAPAPQIMHDSLYMFACQQQQDGSIPVESQINVVCPPSRLSERRLSGNGRAATRRRRSRRCRTRVGRARGA
jgi:alpha-L-rhamnosidase